MEEKNYTRVYVGLGGNIGNTIEVFKKALTLISAIEGVISLKISHFYLTTPVSAIPQHNYTNAVCCFDTQLTPLQLFRKLEKIELQLGKLAKPKDEPRIIDLDILFFGHKYLWSDELKIPHPHWNERLFVLIPLMDLTDEIFIPSPHNPSEMIKINLAQFILTFPNNHHENVFKLDITSEKK